MKSAASCLHTQAILLGFGITVQARVLSDGTAGIGIASRQGCGKLKHLEVRWLWVQEKVQDKSIVLKKQRGETNGADLATKYLTKPRMEFLLGLLALSLVQESEAAAGGLLMLNATLNGGWVGNGMFSTMLLLSSAAIALATCRWKLAASATSERVTSRRGTAARTIAQAEAAGTHARAPTVGPAMPPPPPPPDSPPDQFGELVMFVMFLEVFELQILLRARGLEASGDKHTLCSRLVRQLTPQTTQSAFLRFLTVYELKLLLKSRGLAVGGVKVDLIDRLVEHSRRRDL